MIAIRAAFVFGLILLTALQVIMTSPPVWAAPSSGLAADTDDLTTATPASERYLAQAVGTEQNGPRQLGAVPNSVEVPSLQCLSAADAEATLRQSQLRLGQIHRRPSSTCPNGGVVAQSPPRGTTVRPGTSVEIIVAATSGGVAPEGGTTIPDLEGLTPAEAQSLLRREGFEIGQISRESASAPLGTIIGQVPPPGSPSTIGTRVNIIVAAEVRVPDLRRLTQDEALQRLSEASLSLGRVTEENSTLPNGTVIKQWPLPGVPAAADDKVDITIAKALLVPNVVSLSLDAARAALREAGLRPGQVNSRASDRPRGTIIEQRPSANATITSGATVDVVLAAEPVVPNLTGRTLDQAKRLLNGQFLTLGSVTSKVSSEPQGTVLEQTPSANTGARPRSPVNVVIAEGLETPALVGMSLDEAGAELAKQLMRLGNIEREITADGDGRIVRQTPAAGAPVNLGVAIDVVVRMAPTVPNLLGLRSDSVTARLAEQRLTVNEVNYQLAPETLDQTVIRQDPPPGTTIENGNTVNIVLAVTGPPPDRPDLVAVPRLSGLSVKQAEQNIGLSGLILRIDGNPITDQPHQIATQVPEPGRFVKAGAPVTAFVEAIDTIIVPDLFGIDQSTVGTALADAFLETGEQTWELSTKPQGTVIKQDPLAGTEVSFGNPIDIVLSASALIPDLTGMTPEEATPILAGQALQLGGVKETFSLRWPGTIVSQSPPPDTPTGAEDVVRVEVVGMVGPLSAGGLLLLALAGVIWVKARQPGQAAATAPHAGGRPPPVYGIAKSAAPPRPTFNRTTRAARPETAAPAAPEPSYVVALDTGTQVIQTDAPNLVKPSIRLRGRADPGEQKLVIESS